jgi:hypothetical protein
MGLFVGAAFINGENGDGGDWEMNKEKQTKNNCPTSPRSP